VEKMEGANSQRQRARPSVLKWRAMTEEAAMIVVGGTFFPTPIVYQSRPPPTTGRATKVNVY